MLPALPVLAAGVVGTCLGGVVTALWFRGTPTVPLASACAREVVLARGLIAATEELSVAHQQVVEAHDAMGLLAQRLSDEMRARVATEQEFADVHLKLARANAKLQQFAEEDAGLDLEPAA